MQFIHHPDEKIIIDGLVMEVSEFVQLEPEYSLPAGYIGRVYQEGVMHHLITADNAGQDQADINDVTLAGYVAQKAQYEADLEVLRNSEPA